VYSQDRCLIYAVDAAGVVRWSLPTASQHSYSTIPVKVASDGDDFLIAWTPIDAPVVVARVDAATGADVWRFHLPAGHLVEADLIVDKSSLRLAIERHPEPTEPTLIDVFDLDPQSGEARWAVQIPLSGLDTNDIDEMLDAYPFTYDTELTVIPAGSTLQVSTGPDLYTLSSSNGMIVRMLDVDGTLAELYADPGREMVMRTNTFPDGVVTTSVVTVAMIQ
jgi:outer membrane protein assembly factor BamB